MSRPHKKSSSVTVQQVPNSSAGSLPSNHSGSFGPSQKEPALITSKWTIGWQTPTLMIVCYALALVIAFTHLLLFRYIDHKPADGPNQIAPQAYITTASNILANVFGFSLRGALGLAFVQHLWHLLRVSTMKVSTIEGLFGIRTNPLMFFKPAILNATPTLCALALIMWVSQFVTSFPPGAITVVSTTKVSYSLASIPSFNASFMGNGSGVDASNFSMLALVPARTSVDGFVAFSDVGINKDNNLINRLGRRILTLGESMSLPSPCGSNCSYTMQFEGPWMECNVSQTQARYDQSSNTTYNGYSIYDAAWFAPNNQPVNPALRYKGNYTQARFNSSTLLPLQADYTIVNGTTNSSLLVQVNNMTCAPSRAKYTVNITYENNLLRRKYWTEPSNRLVNLQPSTHSGVVIVPGFSTPDHFNLGTTPANWSQDALNYYRDNNYMTLITSMTSWLNGTFKADLQTNNPAAGKAGDNFVHTYPAKDLNWQDNFITDAVTGLAFDIGGIAASIVEETRFNTAFGRFANSDRPTPLFNVTQDFLNDYLFNMTMSVMTAFQKTRTTVNATQSSTINIYSFSQPLNLILPYFVTLLVSLPFVVVGCLSLFKNGVSAMDGSFIQIISTSTGSSILDRAAAGGCLGGDESTPQELKDLEIKFGEFIGRDEPGRIKRAGFGVESEVKPLTKGADYGITRWL